MPDCLTNSSPDGKEWVKRKILTTRWDLRRTIEEIEFFAKKYQMRLILICFCIFR